MTLNNNSKRISGKNGREEKRSSQTRGSHSLRLQCPYMFWWRWFSINPISGKMSLLLSVHRFRHRTVEVPMVQWWASSSGSELLCLRPQTEVPFMFSQFIILEIVGTRDQEAMYQRDEQQYNSPQRRCWDTAGRSAHTSYPQNSQ